MKIEKRGKYGGVKVHLDGEEAEEFLNYFTADKKGVVEGDLLIFPPKFAVRLGKKIANLVSEFPTLFEDRTEEEIQEALSSDAEKIDAQLKALGEGKDWKKVK